RDSVLDGRADLYALGAVLYEYLAGVPPFLADNPGAILQMHLNVPPPSLRTKIPALSPELEKIVMRLLQKDPNARYPPAQALREDIERLQAGDAARRPDEQIADAIPLTTPKKPVQRKPQLPPQVRPQPRFDWGDILKTALALLVI